MLRRGLLWLLLCVAGASLSLHLHAQEPGSDLELVVEFQDANPELMYVQGVEGTAIRWVNGTPHLVIYVNRGFRMADALDVLKPFLDKARSKKILTVVDPINEFVATAGVPMGHSTGTADGCNSGTLGIAAIRTNEKEERVKGYITASHVATAVKPRQCPNGKGDEQVSPGQGDHPHCSPSPTIGRLIKATRIPSGGQAGTVDAAFVQSDKVDETNACNICPSDLTIQDKHEAARLHLDVRACVGDSTTAKEGKVDAVRAKVWVHFECNYRAMFVEQIIVDGKNFGPFGSSGAVVYGKTAKVLGLIFAGDTDTKTAVNPMADVLTALDIKEADIRCKK